MPTAQKIDGLEDSRALHKCILIMNALERGWTVKKKKDSYIFYKKHEGKKEILHDGYLETFLTENMDFRFLDK